MAYRIHVPGLAVALLIGSIGTAFAQATVGVPGITGIGVAGVGTSPVTSGQSSSVVAPAPNTSFFTDPLSVGPSQIAPTGPVGSDPLRVGPSQIAPVRGSTASTASCGFPNCEPGED